jgi:biopolymer transport protein ExbD
METLPGVIAGAIAGDSSQTVVIRADQTLTLGDVVGVLDIVKGAGARKFFIATDTEE